MNVSGSCVVTPNTMLRMTRDNRKAAGKPIAMPARAWEAPCRTTAPAMVEGCAPSARRMPISRSRWRTR